jgi:hypothetical protein
MYAANDGQFGACVTCGCEHSTSPLIGAASRYFGGVEHLVNIAVLD